MKKPKSAIYTFVDLPPTVCLNFMRAHVILRRQQRNGGVYSMMGSKKITVVV
jgi:hypothetical protein